MSECESAGPGGHALIALGFHPARAGNVDAGTEVIVLCQTSAAEMKLVDFAVNDRVIFAAKIASTAYRLFIRDRSLFAEIRRLRRGAGRLRFQVKSGGHEQRSHAEDSGAQAENAAIVLPESGGEETKTNERRNGAHADHPITRP